MLFKFCAWNCKWSFGGKRRSPLQAGSRICYRQFEGPMCLGPCRQQFLQTSVRHKEETEALWTFAHTKRDIFMAKLPAGLPPEILCDLGEDFQMKRGDCTSHWNSHSSFDLFKRVRLPAGRGCRRLQGFFLLKERDLSFNQQKQHCIANSLYILWFLLFSFIFWQTNSLMAEKIQKEETTNILTTLFYYSFRYNCTTKPLCGPIETTLLSADHIISMRWEVPLDDSGYHRPGSFTEAIFDSANGVLCSFFIMLVSLLRSSVMAFNWLFSGLDKSHDL